MLQNFIFGRRTPKTNIHTYKQTRQDETEGGDINSRLKTILWSRLSLLIPSCTHNDTSLYKTGKTTTEPTTTNDSENDGPRLIHYLHSDRNLHAHQTPMFSLTAALKFAISAQARCSLDFP